MKTHLYIPGLILVISMLAAPFALAQGEVDESLTGAPEPNPSPGAAAADPSAVYVTPAESVTGAPAPNPSPPVDGARPPVTYSTPSDSSTPMPPAPGNGLLQDDFENLHYQNEMWREYQRDYQRRVGD